MMDEQGQVYEYLRGLGQQMKDGKPLGYMDSLKITAMLEMLLHAHNQRMFEDDLYKKFLAITKW